jgi:hypothetical protein
MSTLLLCIINIHNNLFAQFFILCCSHFEVISKLDQNVLEACKKRNVECKKRIEACKKLIVACKKRIVACNKHNVTSKKRSVVCKKCSV